MMAGCALALSGASTSIGVARSYGEFKVDGASVRGNSTLLSGDVIESTTLSTTANIGKAELTLMPASRVSVYRDHTALQKGTAMVRGASHAVEAGVLRVVPEAAHSVVEVGYSGQKAVTISAHAGGANVYTSGGVLLASLNPGGVLAFEPSVGGRSASAAGQASANTALSLHGKLTSKDGRFFIVVSGKTYELSSSTVNLASFVGQVVDITASYVSTTGDVTIASVSTVTSASAADDAGLSPLTITVLLGVAAVATIGGLAAAGSFSGSTPASVP